MIRKVLGIDLASSKWSAVGSATIEFDDAAKEFTRVVAGAMRWPRIPLTPDALAEAIDAFVRREGICAVALDGPQGWRDPATPPGARGVGRRCEYECRTQGKTGVFPRTYPRTQREWIEFCIEVFASLLGRPGVALADPATAGRVSDGYVVLECFPTSAWRSSGLVPLPAKGKRPDLAPYLGSLAAAYRLPAKFVANHDDLQAVIAAISAAAAVGGPVIAVPRGAPGRLIARGDGSPLRIEGYIWDVKPCYRDAPTTKAALMELTVRPVCATGDPRAVEPADSALNVAEYLASMPTWRMRDTRYVRAPNAISRTGSPEPCVSFCSLQSHCRRTNRPTPTATPPTSCVAPSVCTFPSRRSERAR